MKIKELHYHLQLLKQKRILLIHEEIDNGWPLYEDLKTWGCLVAEENNIHKAARTLFDNLNKGKPFDLVVFDFYNKSNEFLSFAKGINRNYKFKNLEMVLLSHHSKFTNYLIKDDQEWGLCLSKPISHDDLYYEISNLLLGKIDFHNHLSSSELQIEKIGGDSPKVLITDDNEINRKVAHRLLESLGCSCFSVDSGQASIEAVIKNDYDLVLMDIDMPEMNGLEATRNIHLIRQELELNPLPVVAFTAHVTDDNRTNCQKAGMVDFLPKPISRDSLKTVLDNWVSGKKPDFFNSF